MFNTDLPQNFGKSPQWKTGCDNCAALKREIDEAKAALSGRTISCVCGGVGAEEKALMEAVVGAAREFCDSATGGNPSHRAQLRMEIAALDAFRRGAGK